MEIKEDKKLKIGQIINFPVYFCDKDRGGNYVTENLDLIVTEIYTHHVLFYSIKYPHMKVDITNVDLWLKGIYKTADKLKHVNPEDCLHGTQGGLKFFDRQI